jgi:hypothetical protein
MGGIYFFSHVSTVVLCNVYVYVILCHQEKEKIVCMRHVCSFSSIIQKCVFFYSYMLVIANDHVGHKCVARWINI